MESWCLCLYLIKLPSFIDCFSFLDKLHCASGEFFCFFVSSFSSWNFSVFLSCLPSLCLSIFFCCSSFYSYDVPFSLQFAVDGTILDQPRILSPNASSSSSSSSFSSLLPANSVTELNVSLSCLLAGASVVSSTITLFSLNETSFSSRFFFFQVVCAGASCHDNKTGADLCLNGGTCPVGSEGRPRESQGEAMMKKRKGSLFGCWRLTSWRCRWEGEPLGCKGWHLLFVLLSFFLFCVHFLTSLER